MDADGSHPPETLPVLVAAAFAPTGLRLAIGSRWVPGGRVENWPRRRIALSRGGNLYARVVLGVEVRDITAGFRVFPAAVLRSVLARPVDAHGYYFQVEMAVRALEAGWPVVEVPIVFREREHGESKMSGTIVREAMVKVTALAWRRRRRRT